VRKRTKSRVEDEKGRYVSAVEVWFCCTLPQWQIQNFGIEGRAEG